MIRVKVGMNLITRDKHGKHAPMSGVGAGGRAGGREGGRGGGLVRDPRSPRSPVCWKCPVNQGGSQTEENGENKIKKSISVRQVSQ